MAVLATLASQNASIVRWVSGPILLEWRPQSFQVADVLIPVRRESSVWWLALELMREWAASIGSFFHHDCVGGGFFPIALAAGSGRFPSLNLARLRWASHSHRRAINTMQKMRARE